MDVKTFLRILVTFLFFNKTVAIHPCPFSNETKTIDLSGLMISAVTSDLFTFHYNCSDYIGDTTRLNITSNSITEIHEDSFQGFYSLTHLDLGNNSISNIRNGTFISNVGNLEYLYLSYNNLTSLFAGTFNLYSLKEIHLDHNNISYVEPYVVDDINENLKLFNMTYNSLTELDPWPYLVAYTNNSRMTRLFDLSNNQIANLTNSLNWTYNLQYPYEVELNLQNNYLEKITMDDLRKFKPDVEEKDSYAVLLTFYMNITQNPFFCDCKMHTFANDIRSTFLRWTRVEEYRYRCATPTQYDGIDWLHDLPLYNFVCNVTDSCPNNCTCQERPHNDTMYVDCRGAGLTEFPETLPETERGKIELFLDNNFITSITNTSYLHKVYNLSMSDNRLSSMDEYILKMMPNVSHMDFSNNRIRTLPTFIQRFNYDDVKLTGNPLFCDCDSLWLADWASLSISRTATLTCDSETGVRSVTDITQDNLDCISADLIIMGVLIGVSVFALLLIGLFVYRCPYETKVLLYKIFRIHPWNKYIIDEDDSMDIDVYLVFDDKPDVVGWVKRFLVNLRKKKPYYRILNPYRFTEPEAQEKVIRKWIAKSKRVLVFLSEDLLANNWRMYEIKVAEDNLISAMAKNNSTNVDSDDFDEENFDSVEKAAEIIYVKYSDDIHKTLEEEPWKTRLSGKPVLDVKDRMFMSKLRYELPQKGSGTKYDDNIRIVAKRDIQRLRDTKRHDAKYSVVDENDRLSPEPGPSNVEVTDIETQEKMQWPLSFGAKPILEIIQDKVRPKPTKKVRREPSRCEFAPRHILKDERSSKSKGSSVNVIQVHSGITSDDHLGIRLEVLNSRTDSRTQSDDGTESDSVQSENNKYISGTDYSKGQNLTAWEGFLKLINPSDNRSISSGYSSDNSRISRRSSPQSKCTSTNVETRVLPTHSRHHVPTNRGRHAFTSQNVTELPHLRHNARIGTIETVDDSARTSNAHQRQQITESGHIESREIVGPNVLYSDLRHPSPFTNK